MLAVCIVALAAQPATVARSPPAAVFLFCNCEVLVSTTKRLLKIGLRVAKATYVRDRHTGPGPRAPAACSVYRQCFEGAELRPSVSRVEFRQDETKLPRSAGNEPLTPFKCVVASNRSSHADLPRGPSPVPLSDPVRREEVWMTTGILRLIPSSRYGKHPSQSFNSGSRSEAKDNASWSVREGSSAAGEGSFHLLPSLLTLNHSRRSVSAFSSGGRAAICLARRSPSAMK